MNLFGDTLGFTKMGVTASAKAKQQETKKNLGSLSDVADTGTSPTKTIAQKKAFPVGLGATNKIQNLANIPKMGVTAGPFKFENLLGQQQGGLPNLGFTNLGMKAPTVGSKQVFQEKLDSADQYGKDKIRTILTRIENGGLIDKTDIDELMKPLKTDDEKRNLLDFVSESGVKVEGIDFNNEPKEGYTIGDTDISVNPIKQAGEKILQAKEYLKNNPQTDPVLKTILQGVVELFDPTGGLTTAGIMQTDIVNNILPKTDNPVTQGLMGFAGNTIRGVGQVIEGGAGLVDKSIAGTQSLVQGGPMKQYQTRQTGVGEDVLDIGAGATQTLASIYAIPASLLIGAGIEALPPEGQKAVSDTMIGMGDIIAKTPGLSQWMESLPPERRDEFKSELAGAAIGMLGGIKGGKNIIKNPRLFLKENLNPVQIAKNFNENVIGIPNKALETAVSTVGKMKIPEVNIKTPNIITDIRKTISPDIDTLIDKSIKPTVIGKTKNVGEIQNYRTNVKKGMDAVIENKDIIKYKGDDGIYKEGGLPETVEEFAQAIDQSKKAIYEKYNAETKKAGSKGAVVDTTPIVLELQKLDEELAGQIGTKSTRSYIQKQIKEIEEIGGMTPEMAQKNKQFLNNKLQAYYRSPNPNEIGNVLVDALINNNLGKSLDDTIMGALDNPQYRRLKDQYGSLSSIEKDVVKRALVNSRKNTKGLVDFTDVMFAGDIATSLLTGNPVSALKGLAGFGLKEGYKFLNNVDNNVKSLFNKYSKNVTTTTDSISDGMSDNLPALPQRRAVDYAYAPKKTTPTDLGSNLDKQGRVIKQYTARDILEEVRAKKDKSNVSSKIDTIKAKDNQNIAVNKTEALKKELKGVKSDTLVSKSDGMKAPNKELQPLYDEAKRRKKTGK